MREEESSWQACAGGWLRPHAEIPVQRGGEIQPIAAEWAVSFHSDKLSPGVLRRTPQARSAIAPTMSHCKRAPALCAAVDTCAVLVATCGAPHRYHNFISYLPRCAAHPRQFSYSPFASVPFSNWSLCGARVSPSKHAACWTLADLITFIYSVRPFYRMVLFVLCKPYLSAASSHPPRTLFHASRLR